MNGFLKGALTGLASFTAGMVVLAAILPPDPAGPPVSDATGPVVMAQAGGATRDAPDATGTPRPPASLADLASQAVTGATPTGPEAGLSALPSALLATSAAPPQGEESETQVPAESMAAADTAPVAGDTAAGMPAALPADAPQGTQSAESIAPEPVAVAALPLDGVAEAPSGTDRGEQDTTTAVPAAFPPEGAAGAQLAMTAAPGTILPEAASLLDGVADAAGLPGRVQDDTAAATAQDGLPPEVATNTQSAEAPPPAPDTMPDTAMGGASDPDPDPAPGRTAAMVPEPSGLDGRTGQGAAVPAPSDGRAGVAPVAPPSPATPRQPDASGLAGARPAPRSGAAPRAPAVEVALAPGSDPAAPADLPPAAVPADPAPSRLALAGTAGGDSAQATVSGQGARPLAGESPPPPGPGTGMAPLPADRSLILLVPGAGPVQEVVVPVRTPETGNDPTALPLPAPSEGGVDDTVRFGPPGMGNPPVPASPAPVATGADPAVPSSGTDQPARDTASRETAAPPDRDTGDGQVADAPPPGALSDVSGVAPTPGPVPTAAEAVSVPTDPATPGDPLWVAEAADRVSAGAAGPDRPATADADAPVPGDGMPGDGMPGDGAARLDLPPGAGSQAPPVATQAGADSEVGPQGADTTDPAEPAPVAAEGPAGALTMTDPPPEPDSVGPLASDQGATLPPPDAPAPGRFQPAPAGRLTPGSSVEGVRLGRLPQVAASPDDSAPLPVASAAPLTGAGEVSSGAPVVTLGRLPQVAPGAGNGDTPPTAPPPAPPTASPGGPGPPPTGAAAGATTGTAPVMVNRLPQVAPADAAGPVAGAATAPADPGPDPQAAPPWRRHAAPVPPSDLPRLGLVLLDVTRDLAAEAALVDLPFAVTVGLDPFDPDALRRALIYRATGHEVVLVLDGVSPLSTASDLEVLFAAWQVDFPEMLGVVDVPTGDGRRARALAQSLVPLLRDTGLALIAPDRGLSPLLTAARAGGVAQAGLYRSLDPADETADAVRRFLDRAAFEAERQGSLAVIGSADRPATLAGIADWLAGPRAARVQAVPVGAVLAMQGAN